MKPKSPFVERLDALLWTDRLDRMPLWQRRLVWLARLLNALIRDLTQGYLSLEAMSLVYTTLLSLVPLLAVSFSVLKGFGVHNQLEPWLLQALSPLGEKAAELTESIIGFVDNMKVGVLGSVGLAILIYTVVALIQKIEQVFNHTWRAEEGRPFAQRFGQYLSVLLIGPVLFFSAVGLSASIGSSAYVAAVLAIEPFGTLIETLSRALPFALLVLSFAFIYVFVPNARVHLGSAMIGGLVAAILWQSVGWVFAHFMVSSTQYTAVYSSLAILILFMIWVYIAWLILLVGASVAFYHQHPEYLTSRSWDLKLSSRLRERIALLAAGHIARTHAQGGAPWTGDALSAALGVPRPNTQPILDTLEREGVVVRSAGDPPGYLPARAPEGIRIKSLLDGVRHFEEHGGCRGTPPDPAIGAIERRIDSALDAALGDMTLKNLADALQDPGPAVRDDPLEGLAETPDQGPAPGSESAAG
jgi:membrane protein